MTHWWSDIIRVNSTLNIHLIKIMELKLYRGSISFRTLKETFFKGFMRYKYLWSIFRLYTIMKVSINICNVAFSLWNVVWKPKGETIEYWIQQWKLYKYQFRGCILQLGFIDPLSFNFKTISQQLLKLETLYYIDLHC